MIIICQDGKAIEAYLWEQNGDHPKDNCSVLKNSDGNYFLSEGKVVRYYRHPEVAGTSICSRCGKIMHEHGWIEISNVTVCPGDYVVEFDGNYFISMSKDGFIKLGTGKC